jgi:methionyl-tRNA synthetase
MSKSKGTFIMADTYLKYLEPEYLRYYYAGKLSNNIDDIDLNFNDFTMKINSDLVGKLANLASRSVPMLTKGLDGRLGELDSDGKELVGKLQEAKKEIANNFENLNYSSAIRTISALADESNRYIDQKEPWTTIKSDPEQTRSTLTAVINAVKILTIYLKAVLPKYAEKVEAILNVEPLGFADVDTVMEKGDVNRFERLAERVDMKKVEAMVEESRASGSQKAGVEDKAELDEPLEPECTIEDFMKVDLRIAKITLAEPVEGADKLLHLELDIGGIKKNVFAGIAKAYKPEDLVGKVVVCVANLKPRKMKFGVSEGMILASGPGGKGIFMLSADEGAKPGQRVH